MLILRKILGVWASLTLHKMAAIHLYHKKVNLRNNSHLSKYDCP